MRVLWFWSSVPAALFDAGAVLALLAYAAPVAAAWGIGALAATWHGRPATRLVAAAFGLIGLYQLAYLLRSVAPSAGAAQSSLVFASALLLAACATVVVPGLSLAADPERRSGARSTVARAAAALALVSLPIAVVSARLYAQALSRAAGLPMPELEVVEGELSSPPIAELASEAVGPWFSGEIRVVEPSLSWTCVRRILGRGRPFRCGLMVLHPDADEAMRSARPESNGLGALWVVGPESTTISILQIGTGEVVLEERVPTAPDARLQASAWVLLLGSPLEEVAGLAGLWTRPWSPRLGAAVLAAGAVACALAARRVRRSGGTWTRAVAWCALIAALGVIAYASLELVEPRAPRRRPARAHERGGAEHAERRPTLGSLAP